MSRISVSPKKLIWNLTQVISKGLVPFIIGSPGIGKSDIIRKVAQMGNLKVIDIRLAQSDPTDLHGFPSKSVDKNGIERAQYIPFNTFPIEGTKLPINPENNQPYAGWLLFFDEVTSASKSVQAACYKIILDRMVDQYNLDPRVAIVAAGNKVSDKAVTFEMSTALKSRMIHFELNINKDEWIDWAINNNFDKRIIGFIEFMPSRLQQFDPSKVDTTFACPRTWEFLNKLISNVPNISEDYRPMISGTISEGVAAEFISFASLYENLPNISEIVKNPSEVAVPKDGGTRYAVITHLWDYTTVDNLSKILEYTNRFDIEYQIVFLRGLKNKDNNFLQNKDFLNNAQRLARYLFSD